MAIYYLNGLTSTGKTSIVAALFAAKRRAFFALGFDLFEETMPPWLADDDRAYAKAIRALYAAARGYAEQGEDVVIDGLVMNMPGLERHYETLLTMLGGCELRMIDVCCPMDELRRRNLARGDRRERQSEEQSLRAEKRIDYWLTLDTSRLTAAACAALLLDRMDDASRAGTSVRASDATRVPIADPRSVRPAATTDVSRIAELLVFTKRDAYRAVFHDDAGSFGALQALPVIDAYASGERRLAEALVYDDGIVKGVLTRRFASDRAELCELYVEPCFQSQGVGGALLDAFLAEVDARGCSAYLWVIRDNASARRFYASHGFTPTGDERPVEGTRVMEARYQRAPSVELPGSI